MNGSTERTIDVCAREIPWVDWVVDERTGRGYSPLYGVASGAFAHGVSVGVYRTSDRFGAEVKEYDVHGFGDTVTSAVAAALGAWRPVAARSASACAVSVAEAKVEALKAKAALIDAKATAAAAASRAARVRSVAGDVDAQIRRLREVEATQLATEPQEVPQ